MTLLGLVAGALIIIAGLVALFWGSQLYKFMLPLLTGLAGIFLGLSVGSELDSMFYALVLAAVLGVAGAVLAFFLWKAGVVINFYTLGYLGGTLLVRSLGLDAEWFSVMSGVGLGLVVSYFVIAFRAWEWVLAAVMSLNGGFMITAGIVSIVYGAEVAFRHRSQWTESYGGVPEWVDVLMLVLAAGLAIYGFRHQVENNPDLQELKFERAMVRSQKEMHSAPSSKSKKTARSK